MDNLNYKKLIENLKNYRISIFMTQKDVANRCDISLHTVSNLENGDNVSAYALFSYIQALGIEQDFINFPPVKMMRFEDLPAHKYSRARVRKKKTAIHWGDEK